MSTAIGKHLVRPTSCCGSLVLLGLVLASACRTETDLARGSGAGGDEAQSGSGNAGASAEQAGLAGLPCSPLASPEEIASTPRADEDLELLAMTQSSGLVVSQDEYDRVVEDLVTIRELVPELASIRYAAPWDGKSLWLAFDEATTEKVSAGDYRGWDCLNESYGFRKLEEDPMPLFTLRLKGIYDMPRLAEQYASLPGVESATAVTEDPAPTGVDDGLCLLAIDTEYRYVFWREEQSVDDPGQPPSVTYRYWGFASQSIGDVGVLGTWESADEQPPWVPEGARCGPLMVE